VESGDAGPRTFTLRAMLRRVADVGDLWSDMARHAQPLRRAVALLRDAPSQKESG
jgi:DNA primase